MGLKFYQTFCGAAGHVGDIPTECTARIVGQYETILYERPSEVAPRRNSGTSGMLFKLQLEDPTRDQRVNILTLDKITA